MKKLLYNKYNKRLINSLPQASFKGRIVVVASEAEAKKAISFLLTQPILGVDTETRPSFRKGTHYKVSLLQVANHDICFLFRLNHIGLCQPIKELLENKQVAKVGVSLHDDVHMLHGLGSFTPENFIDLQEMVTELGIEDKSLQKLYANFFGEKISKSQRLTNWETDILSDKQKIYAATDAWSCINIYEEFIRLKTTGQYILEKVEEPNDNISDVQDNTPKEG